MVFDLDKLSDPEENPHDESPFSGISLEMLQKLTEKQRKWLEHYLLHRDAREAYKAAGYTYKNADSLKVNSSRILHHPKIQAILHAVQCSIVKKTIFRTERTMEELSHIAYYDPADVYDFSGDVLEMKPPSQIPEGARKAIQSVEVDKSSKTVNGVKITKTKTRLTFHSKNQALGMLGKFQGMEPAQQLKIKGQIDHKHKHAHMHIRMDALSPQARKIVEELNSFSPEVRKKMLELDWVPVDVLKEIRSNMLGEDTVLQNGLKEIPQEEVIIVMPPGERP